MTDGAGAYLHRKKVARGIAAYGRVLTGDFCGILTEVYSWMNFMFIK